MVSNVLYEQINYTGRNKNHNYKLKVLVVL